MFALESPHRGVSNENTQYTIFNMNKKNTLNLQLRIFFQGTQERVRNSRGKRVISVRAIEVQLKYTLFCTIPLAAYFLSPKILFISRHPRQAKFSDQLSLVNYKNNLSKRRQ